MKTLLASGELLEGFEREGMDFRFNRVTLTSVLRSKERKQKEELADYCNNAVKG